MKFWSQYLQYLRSCLEIFTRHLAAVELLLKTNNTSPLSSVENVELETDKRRFHEEMYFLLTINNSNFNPSFNRTN